MANSRVLGSLKANVPTTDCLKPGRDNFPVCVAGVESSSSQSADKSLGARILDPSHTNSISGSCFEPIAYCPLPRTGTPFASPIVSRANLLDNLPQR